MELETVSYQEIIDGYEPQGDEYGLAAYALAQPRKKAFLSNPYLHDYTKVMLKLLRHDGKIIGRSMMFPSSFKAGKNIVSTVGGSALEVAKDYRNSEAGGVLMAYNIRHKENNAIISSGFSDAAFKCHKALRAYMLCFPQLIQIRNYRKILLKIGLNYYLSSIVGYMINLILWPFACFIKHKSLSKLSCFQVEELTIIPDWVDDIALNDGHTFMEVHDHKWLQWNLDNRFHDHENNSTRFFSVSKEGKNVGFFMIKERYQKINDSNTNDILIGSICEWGSADLTRLSEYDLHLIALNYFSKTVDAIFMATNDKQVEHQMKRLFFIRRGEAQIAFYDLRKEYKEAKNINLWRVRLGYADTILN